MTVEQQIDAFVQGIQCATTQSIVVNLAGDQTVRTSFDDYYNAVATRLELAMTLTGKTNNTVTRNVNQMTKVTSSSKREGNGNTSSSKPNKRPNGAFKPEARRYSAEEWRALTSEQKDQVKALHKILKGNRQNATNSVVTVNEGAIVPYGANQTHNNHRYLNQVNANDNVSYASYPHNNGAFPNYRSLNQLTYNNGWTPPTPSVTIPPPPPARTGTPSSGSLTAESGEVGNSWGNHPYSRSN